MPTSFTTVSAGDTITSTQQNALYAAVNNVEKGTTFYILTTGSANAYLAALSPAHTALVAGNILHIKASFTNTGAATINVNSLGAIAIQRPGGVALDAGNIVSGNHYTLRHDGSVWQLLNPNQSRWVQGGGNATPVGNVGSGEDDLKSFSLPGGSLGQDNMLMDGRWHFTFAANANNKTVKVKFGATTVYDTTAVAQNGGSLIVELQVWRTAAATQDWELKASVENGMTLITNTIARGTAAETLSGDITVKATGEATTTDDIVNESLRYSWG